MRLIKLIFMYGLSFGLVDLNYSGPNQVLRENWESLVALEVLHGVSITSTSSEHAVVALFMSEEYMI